MTTSERISAGELRAMGAAIDPRIPDCATVPRAAVRFDPESATAAPDPNDPTLVNLGVTARVSEPFEWVEVVVDVGDAQP